MARGYRGNTYVQWLDMTQRERENLYQAAMSGDKESRSLFYKISTSLRIEANKRLRELRKHDYDYGKVYDNLMRYLQTEQRMNRVPTLSELDRDIDKLHTVNEQVRAFLISKRSDYHYRDRETDWRIKTLENNFRDKDFFKSYTRKRKKEFLKWLNTEQASFAMDEFGTSDETIVVLMDAYRDNHKGTEGYAVLEKAMLEFSAGEKSFAQAMLKVGVNVDSGKYQKQNWWYEKVSRSAFMR